MRRAATIASAAIGPLAVAALRFVLPYYTASGSKEAAGDVATHRSRLAWNARFAAA